MIGSTLILIDFAGKASKNPRLQNAAGGLLFWNYILYYLQMAQVNPEIALPIQIVIRIVWACDVQLTQFHEAANPLPLCRRRLHKRPFLPQLTQIRHLLSLSLIHI